MEMDESFLQKDVKTREEYKHPNRTVNVEITPPSV